MKKLVYFYCRLEYHLDFVDCITMMWFSKFCCLCISCKLTVLYRISVRLCFDFFSRILWMQFCPLVFLFDARNLWLSLSHKFINSLRLIEWCILNFIISSLSVCWNISIKRNVPSLTTWVQFIPILYSNIFQIEIDQLLGVCWKFLWRGGMWPAIFLL